MTLPVSAFVICQDEARFLEPCLRSLAICAEIVVVDSGSTDGTLALVERLRDADGLPIRLVREPWRGYAGQKQFALELCTQPWCLSVDSDERLSARLVADLPRLIATDGVNGWRITRYPYLTGHGYGTPATWEGRILRLVRRGTARFDTAVAVHEGLVVEGRVETAPEGGLLHFRPIGLHDQILKENRYSTLKADMKAARGERARPWKMILSPPLYFLRLYLRHGLWRAGWAGVIRACTGAVYAFLTEAKRWEAEALRRHPTVEPPDLPGT